MSPQRRGDRNQARREELKYLQTLPMGERVRRSFHKKSGSHGSSASGYTRKGGALIDYRQPKEINLKVYKVADVYPALEFWPDIPELPSA